MRFILPSLLLFTVLLSACEPPATVPDNGKTITIGVMAPLSGKLDARGKQGVLGSELARKLRPRLDDGTRVKLLIQDSAQAADRSISTFRTLAANPEVMAILDLSTSLSVIEIARIANPYQTPVIATIATHPDVTAYSPWISQLCLDDNFQGTVAALFVSDELLLDRVAVISNPLDAHSRFVANEFIRKFRSVGGSITDEVHLTDPQVDHTRQLEKIRAHDPELLYFALTTEAVLAVLKQTGEMDWYPEVMGTDGFLGNVLNRYPEQLGRVQGMLATDFFSEGISLTPWGKTLVKRYHSDHPGEPTSFTGLGAEGYALLVAAMNRCKDPRSKACINQQIRSTTNRQGIMGTISIDSTGKAHRALFVNTIRKDKMHFVVKVY